MIELFDQRTRLEWESSTNGSVDPPSHEALLDFIAKRILTLNAAKPKPVAKGSGDTSRSAKSHFAKHGSDSARCAVCKGKHSLMQCADFKSKSTSKRKSFVEANGLCYNCLGNHFMAKCQSIKTCLTCKSWHHSLLHDAYTKPQSTEASALVTTHTSDHKAILLAIAHVTINDYLGRPQAVRALIDQGSEVSLVSEALAQRLRLPRARSSMSIVGIGGARSGTSRGRMSMDLDSEVTGATLYIEAYILPRLSSYQGPTMRNHTTWSHIRGLPLADPQYLRRDPIELLLGADTCSAILLDGLRKGSADEPIAQRTSKGLGWILSGGCRSMPLRAFSSSLQGTIDRDLIALVQRFWEQEREQSSPTLPTPDEEKCEEFFIRTHERTAAGRYIVRLPFSGSLPPLAETRKSAERLLTAMER